MPIYKGLQWWFRQSGTDRNSTYTDAGSANYFNELGCFTPTAPLAG